MARGSTLCNCHSSRIPKPPYRVISASQSSRRARGVGRSPLGEGSAIKLRGAQFKSKTLLDARRVGEKTHTLTDTYTEDTHKPTTCQRMSKGEEPAAVTPGPVKLKWSGAGP